MQMGQQWETAKTKHNHIKIIHEILRNWSFGLEIKTVILGTIFIKRKNFQLWIDMSYIDNGWKRFPYIEKYVLYQSQIPSMFHNSYHKCNVHIKLPFDFVPRMHRDQEGVPSVQLSKHYQQPT